jgi:DNA oxidative demethylase
MSTAPNGLLYVSNFLSEEEQDALIRELRRLDYEHDKFRGQRLKRGYAQYGFSYVSTGRKLKPAEVMPEFLRRVVEKARLYCSVDQEFDQCIVTHYPENAGIGWHTDAPKFGECIAGVSLGGSARFQLRPNGSEEVEYEIETVSGSLYIMQGIVRWEYQHQIVPVKVERFSLTFRHAIEETSAAESD